MPFTDFIKHVMQYACLISHYSTQILNILLFRICSSSNIITVLNLVSRETKCTFKQGQLDLLEVAEVQSVAQMQKRVLKVLPLDVTEKLLSLRWENVEALRVL